MEGYPSTYVTIMCIILSMQTLIGVATNLFIMVKWFSDRKMSKTRHLGSGNNFITTLKTMDLLICIFAIPTTLIVLLVEKEKNLVACFIKEGFIMFASSGSAVCVMLISIDRYSATVTPTKPMFTPKSVQICRVSVFGAALVGLSLPLLSLFMGAFHKGILQSVTILPCRSVIWLFKPYYLYETVYVVYFVITICIVFWCYRSVLRVVRRRMEARLSAFPGRISRSMLTKVRKQQEIKATRMTFAVVLSFIVCWGPHVIVTLIQFGLPHSLLVDMIQAGCLCLAYLTPIIHPAIYTFNGSNYTNSNAGNRISGVFSILRNNSRKVNPESGQAESPAQSSVIPIPVQCTSKSYP